MTEAEIIKRYEAAYRRANGVDVTVQKRGNGWYSVVSGTRCRLKHLSQWTEVLERRPALEQGGEDV